MDKLQAEISELRKFEEAAQEQRVKDFLSIQARKLETELVVLKEKASSDSTPPATQSQTSADAQGKVYDTQITTYAYDQSDKFMKIIISSRMEGVGALPSSAISSSFTPRSFRLQVGPLNSRNHLLTITNLFDEIVPADSSVVTKKDSVVVMLKKAKVGKSWSSVTMLKEIEKEKTKMPKLDKEKDPNESLMDMMKHMYESGDDDMKRTIAKAMSESRNKTGMPTGDL